MKPVLIEVEQTSKEWAMWRSEGIGASEAPVIMFDSIDGSPFKLWQEKMGLRQQKADNKFMARGRRVEADARMVYSAQTGNIVPPACYEHPAFPFLKYSSDGAFPVEQPELVIELKSPEFKATHLTVMEGRVPNQYWAQCQQGLLVSGAPKMVFGSYWHGELATIEVTPDYDYIEGALLPSLQRFWRMVLDGRWVAPEGDKDAAKDDDWVAYTNRYKEVVALYEHYKNLLREEESNLARFCGMDSARVSGNGVEAKWVHTVRKAESRPRGPIDTWSLSVREIPAQRVD